ncbi:hypothetical protein GCM10009804_19580 [Kribbella hippodromi]|uniref:DUF3558 domain-containing protein n=1 Tax=Kribbella hippodromi TaxID=434347 RepID=A0ABP4NMQ0_9ACTN
MPEHDPEQELGPKITSALQNQAHNQSGLQRNGLATEARRRVHRRRQGWLAVAGAVAVIVVGGVGVNLLTNNSPVATSSSDSGGSAVPKRSGNALAPTPEAAGSACPTDHPILRAAGPSALQASTGLDLNTPVTGMRACRYGFAEGGTGLLGQENFDAATAQQVVDAIKVLPERNPALPVFKCAPPTAKPSEAIVLRFETGAGVREIWVEYDGCQSAGFFTGSHTYGLYAAPLKLFMTGSVRPSGGTYLNALKGW